MNKTSKVSKVNKVSKVSKVGRSPGQQGQQGQQGPAKWFFKARRINNKNKHKQWKSQSQSGNQDQATNKLKVTKLKNTDPSQADSRSGFQRRMKKTTNESCATKQSTDQADKQPQDVLTQYARQPKHKAAKRKHR